MSGLRNAFIVTGIVAVLGGVVTALVVSSCDGDTCDDMDPNEPGCVPKPEGAARVQLPSGPCDLAARPSVHVVPVRTYDDYMLPVDVDMVWFEHGGHTYEARCLYGDQGCTGSWMAGYELEGPITVSTEYCDTVVSETVDVGRTADGCHVDTEYLLLQVSTRGCLRDRAPEVVPPPPTSTWKLVTAGAPG